jgi:CheY-like chemotaxis protein
LGLSVVHGIIKQSRGTIEIESEPGKGSVFKILLPRVKDDEVPVRTFRTPSQDCHGTETILLVEDESTVRRLIRLLLEKNGYRVLDACDGEEAIRLARQYSEQIHLLITDVVMPNMGGSIVAERILEIHPAAAVLYISGYLDDAVLQHGIMTDHVNFLQKPFNLDSLANKVHSILHPAARVA